MASLLIDISKKARLIPFRRFFFTVNYYILSLHASLQPTCNPPETYSVLNVYSFTRNLCSVLVKNKIKNSQFHVKNQYLAEN